MEKKQENITPTGLKARGWSEAMIKQYLGEPDELKPNPYYKSAAPMRLYSLKRVEKVEKSKKFIEAKAVADRRKESAAKGVATKVEKAIQYAKTVKIEVPVVNYDTLVKHACRHYNDWHECDRNGMLNLDFIPADPKHSATEFLHRITINYLRHECTSYDDELEKLFGKTGIHEAHQILQRRINKEIRATYPQLNDKKQNDPIQEIHKQLDDAVGYLLADMLNNTTHEVAPDPSDEKIEN